MCKETKTNNKSLIRKREIRFHPTETKTRNGKRKISDHPTFIFLQNGDIFIYVQITHSKNIRGKILIKMRKNPNPKDIKDSYYIEEILEDNLVNFGKKHDKWIVDEQDESDIRKQYEKKKSPR